MRAPNPLERWETRRFYLRYTALRAFLDEETTGRVIGTLDEVERSLPPRPPKRRAAANPERTQKLVDAYIEAPPGQREKAVWEAAGARNKQERAAAMRLVQLNLKDIGITSAMLTWRTD
jgi:hypothetical protein